jgi:hypothetical protein
VTLSPTRPPDQEEFPDPAELLIKEARRQSRRRRFVNGLLVVAIVAAATIVITNGGNRSPSRLPTIPPSRGSGSTTVNDNDAGAAVPGGQAVLSLWPVGGQASWVDTVNESALSHGGQGIEWTGNGGRTWRDVTPPGDSYGAGNHFIGDFFALTSTRAWLVAGPVEPGRANSTTVLMTSDAGRRWVALGSLPLSGCSLNFITPLDGVCTFAPGASNSAPVEVATTFNGGRSWTKVFDNFAGMMGGYPAKDGGLPFSCDKYFAVTPPQTLWAEGWCDATISFLYRSTDDGRHWVSTDVTPPSPLVGGGSEFVGPVVLDGREGAVAFQEANFSLIDVTRDGGTTFTPVYPPGPERPWTIDIVTPTTWRLAWRNEILGTNNGGTSWFAVVGNAFSSHSVRYSQRWGNGAPYAMHFTSPSFGWLEWNTASGYTVMTTRDGGRIWHAVAVPGTGKVSTT